MRELPEITGRGERDTVAVRTGHGDGDAAVWRAAADRRAPAADPARPWGGDGGIEPALRLVDDPAWSSAIPERVRAIAAREGELTVVFVADGAGAARVGAYRSF